MNTCKLAYNKFDDTKKILDETDTKYNGRVQIAEPSVEAWFEMQERIAIENKATDYRGALNGNLESSVLSDLFFSAKNIEIIQNGIKAGVYNMSKSQIVVPSQNIDNLKIIMRSTYMQHAEHRKEDIPGQIKKLNDLVLAYAVENVYNGAVSYMKYIQDQSSLATPMDLPSQPDRDFKHLERKHFA
jgi:hypothetical protein